ncbi:MAG: DNA-3-methyladenine glycosylase I [Rudaea sp.]
MAVARQRKRCAWAGTDPVYVAYHDEEWGQPLHDDRRLFELLCLEGAQAGLSWITILRKRRNYRRAFDRFNPKKVAEYDEAKITSLLADPGIVRNRLKVRAFIENARSFLAVKKEFGSFDRYVWSFVGARPKTNKWKTLAEIPASSPEAVTLSNDLRKRGFRFVGPTICYAFMQAAGLVNDHTVDCFRHSEIAKLR